MHYEFFVNTGNMLKADAVRKAVEQMKVIPNFSIYHHSVPPKGIPEQPRSIAETIFGAVIRAEVMHTNVQVSERASQDSMVFFVGIEAGVMNFDMGDNWFSLPAIAVRNIYGETSTALGLGHLIPKKLKPLVIDQEMELGPAHDLISGQKDTKKHHGVVGLATKGIITREETFVPPIIAAICSMIDGTYMK